jgi:serine/threonine protein kinase
MTLARIIPIVATTMAGTEAAAQLTRTMSMSNLSRIPEKPLTLPDAFSRYRPIARIGRGGMAEVILAEMRLGRGATRLAVLKRIWPELAQDPDFVPMFIHEGRLSARMNHPNVVQAYEVLEDAERPAIALEYLDGQPLSKVISRLGGSDALGLGPKLRILRNILAALEYVHRTRWFTAT